MSTHALMMQCSLVSACSCLCASPHKRSWYNGCAHNARVRQIARSQTFHAGVQGIVCSDSVHSTERACDFGPTLPVSFNMTHLNLSMCCYYRLCAEIQGCCQLVVLPRLSCVSSFRSMGARRQDWTSTPLPSMQSQWRQVFIVSMHGSVAWYGKHHLGLLCKPCIAQVMHPKRLSLCSVLAVCMRHCISGNGKAGSMGT